MLQELVTVIVPAYNCEHTIKKCIESIARQTYKNIEIVIINDGSLDCTQTICQNLKKQYSNIILINQKNKGVSESRNIGISNANGYYIMFVDADDYIENNMIEVMMSNNEKQFDFICANYKKKINNKVLNNSEIAEKLLFNKDEFLNIFWELFKKQLINSPVCRLYKRNIINCNNIKFNTCYDLGEDLIFNLEYINKCTTFHIIPDCLYNYIYTDESLTTKYRDDYLVIQMELVKYIKEFTVKNSMYNEENINELIGNIIISSVQNLFLKSSKLKNKQIREKLKEYLNIEQIESLKKVKYNSIKLKILKTMIIKKRVNQIMIYSKCKELIRKILKP